MEDVKHVFASKNFKKISRFRICFDICFISRKGSIRGSYDGMAVLTCLTKATFPRHLLSKLSLSKLASDIVMSVTVQFMLEDSNIGQVRFDLIFICFKILTIMAFY